MIRGMALEAVRFAAMLGGGNVNEALAGLVQVEIAGWEIGSSWLGGNRMDVERPTLQSLTV